MPLSISYSQGLTSAWSNVATFVPKLVAFLIIVIIGYFIAKIISKILAKVLQRVGFDRLIERGGIQKALASSKYDAAEILARLVFYAIMLFVLSTGFGVFGTNPVSNYLHAVIAYLPLVFVAILIVIIAAAVAAGAKTLIQNSLGGLSYASVLANSAAAIIIALGVVAALDQLHIAAAVVNAVLYAVLAAVTGVIIVAVGGGGIKTMSARWELAASRYDQEKVQVQQQVRSAPTVAEQARTQQTQLRPSSSPDREPPFSS
ncbi:MAG TPA: hypothetical protein VGI00_21740 [Streptosporangiaceae bacterium]